MARVRLSPAALADFDSIIDHLVEVAGNRTAADYAERIQAALNRLVMFPGLGAPRPRFCRRTRMTSVPPYLIFYDGGPRSRVVEVLRIVHGRRNITPRLVARGRRR